MLLFAVPAANNKLVLLLLASLLVTKCNGLDNGLALTPPMGWLNWERFTCQLDCEQFPDDCISGRLYEQMARELIEGGFRQVGYEYINIDDCWSELERDPDTGRLVANRTRFPGAGIANLARLVHAHGLKLGIYGDCGFKTCAGYPAQLRNLTASSSSNYLNEPNGGANYFELDAQTFADWTIDSFKFDGCFIEALEAESVCPAMSVALAATRRPILLVCEWPFYMMYAHVEPNYELASESCNVWRYYDDIEDSWQSILNTIDYTVRHQSTIVKYHGPGHWFDPDQLVIGNFGLSQQQWAAQMALWCMWSAPLYMSNDLRKLHPKAKQILTNTHLIGINQDKLGVFAQMVKELRTNHDDDFYQAYVKPILPIRRECPSFALLYFNRNTLGGQIKVSFKLADLLTGAPLNVARKHALELLEREPRNEVAQAAANFQPSRCLEWLQQATLVEAARESDPSDASKEDGEEDGEFRHQAAKFKVFDLIEEIYLFQGRPLGVEEELKLPVSPSGVRAVRLEAI